jgi:O-antigen biosynthesis protein
LPFLLNESQKSYPDRADITEEELDSNSSYSKMLELVGESKRVLDVGCASGYLARLLSARGNRITGLDVNEEAARKAQEHCERVLVADLDTTALTDLLPGETFDVIVFGDVLEHLRNPWLVLDSARQLLAYQGYAVVSIPNIAHGAIRLALLKGRFDYSEFGILDNTHLRFFTRETVDQLFVQSGYRIERIEKTKLPLFEASNLVPTLFRSDFDEALVAGVQSDVDFDTLQFVVKAKALTDDEKLAWITQRYLEVSRDAIDRLEEERNKFRELQQREAELESAVAEISTSLDSTILELDARFTAANNEARLLRFAYDELCVQLTTTREALRKYEAKIEEMQLSKFWKLRDLVRRLTRFSG